MQRAIESMEATSRSDMATVPAKALREEAVTCVWRIATRADITGKSRREREMPLPF